MIQRIDAAGHVALKDGSSVTIRRLQETDQAALTVFGQSLPKDDLLYLEDDFTHPEIITRLANAAHAENWRQIVAVGEDSSIEAYAAARRLPGWSFHVADIRLIVLPRWRSSGLGTQMAQAIVDEARALGVIKVTVDITAAQQGGQAIFSRLGFAVEGRLARHVVDRNGNQHDIVLMSAFVQE